MTKQEFDDWTKHTARSKRGWQRDDVTLYNHGVYLLYHGGVNGRYVQINDAIVTVGKYEDAIPHIGDAEFTILGRKQFHDQSSAFSAVSNATGIHGLLALLCGGESFGADSKWA